MTSHYVLVRLKESLVALLFKEAEMIQIPGCFTEPSRSLAIWIPILYRFLLINKRIHSPYCIIQKRLALTFSK